MIDMSKGSKSPESKSRRRPTSGERLAVKTLSWFVAIGALTGVSVWGQESIQFFGVGKHDLSEQELEALAKKDYAADFRKAAPAEKFQMQYVAPQQYTIEFAKTFVPGKGIVGGLSQMISNDQYLDVGQSCLSTTAYDVSANTTKGFGSHGKSYTPAGVIVDPTNPDQLSVVSGNPSLPILEFKGLKGDMLTPVDAQTYSQLGAYGCSSTLNARQS